MSADLSRRVHALEVRLDAVEQRLPEMPIVDNVTLNEMLQTAIDAEQRGVVINWKEMALRIYQVATNHIAGLESDDQPTEE